MAFNDSLSAALFQADGRVTEIVNNFAYLGLGEFCDGKILES